jgi:hypothetical protein
MEPAVFPLVLGVVLVTVVHRWPERGIGTATTFVLEVIGTSWI